MKNNDTLVDFIFNPSLPFSKERYEQIKEDSGKYLVTPLKVIAMMVAISGIFAMIFEVRHHSELAVQIYFVRLIATLISFLVLVLLNTKYAMKLSIMLVHILLLTIIISSAIMILLIPNTLIVNSQIVGLMIFTSAMFLNWEVKNQILVAIYYNVVFAVAILFNNQQIYFLPNMFESLLFVLFLSMLSVVGSAINFRMRLQIAENSFRTELSERKYKSIFENSNDGVYQSNHEGDFLTANMALVKMLGFETLEELMLTNITDFYFNKQDREKLLSEIKRKGTIENYLLHLIDKNKKKIIVRLNARMVSDADNLRYYFEGNMHDVTTEITALEERNKAEAELKIEKEKADKFAKDALQLSMAKSKFLANMSHEIRTPMNGIFGYLSLIESESYSSKEELKQFVSTAKLSAESLLETINAVLDLSKIEAGKIELENLNFNLKKIINQAISIVSPKANEKGLKISLQISDYKGLHFVGDPTRIRQIFLNLLSNAIKFTENGEIRIDVAAEDVDNDKVKVKTSILDTGIGIPADKINVLFKPFSQIDGTEGKQFGGTGLGLVICKEFTNLMEGDIGVQSVDGKGSQFDFSICVKKQHNVEHDLPENQELQSQQNQILQENTEIDIKQDIEKRKKYKILLAEDNLINQKVAVRTLNSVGYEVDAVMNGEQAIRALSQKDYDLILMDVQMPEIDGYAATKIIREMDAPKNAVPIIAITAHAMIGDREKCFEAGMNDYLSKPVLAKDIIRIIDKHLSVHQQVKTEDTKNNIEPAHFDFDRLRQVSLGDKTFEKDLLSDYLIDVESKLQVLREILPENDIKKIIDIAHTIKGSSYSVGAKLIGDEALGIELSAKSNDIDSVEDRLVKLAKSLRETRDILKDLL